MSTGQVTGIDAGHEWSPEDFNGTSPDAAAQWADVSACDIPSPQPFEQWVQGPPSHPHGVRGQGH